MKRIFPGFGHKSCLSTGLLLALVITGYPIAGFLSDILNAQSNIISVLFRIIVLILSIYVIGNYFNGRKLLGAWISLLIFLWLVYALRLYIDLLKGNPVGAGDALVFYCVVVILPSFALIFSDRERLELVAGPAVFWVGSLVVVSALVLEYSGYLGTRSLLSLTGQLSAYSVNPITIGHTASSTIIAALAIKRYNGGAWMILKLAAIIISLICLVFAGSKGAFIALVSVILFLLLARARISSIAAVMLSLLILGAPFVTLDWYSYNLPLLERLAVIGVDESTEERVQLYTDAIEQFIRNPVFGSAYVESNSGTYPHNLLLESFMSLGLPGGVVFLSLSVAGLYRAWKYIRCGLVLVPLLYVQALVGGMFSGSLYAHASLWGMLAILLAPSIQVFPVERSNGLRKFHTPDTTDSSRSVY